jgi:large subunit ribosomal protein L4
MKKIKMFSAVGGVEEVAVPASLKGEPNLVLLAQAVRVYEDRLHKGLSKVKTRGEVNRTTKKWFRQKGTGRARHGAQSAPIFVGGGVAHGPKGMKRVLALPTKMKREALRSALVYKASKGMVVFVDGLGDLKKTKEANALANRFLEGKKHFTLALGKDNLKAGRAFANIADGKVLAFGNLSVYDVFAGGLIVVDVDAIGDAKKSGKGKAKK